MPDTKSEPNDSASPEKSGGKGRLIITAVLCLGLAAAGFVLGGRLSAGGDAEAASADGEAEEAEETEKVVGGIVELDAVNVNLADGHYLRISVAVALSEEYVHAHSDGGGHGGGDDEIPFEKAPAADLVLGTFSGRHMEELTTHEGRDQARHDLYEGLVDYYGEEEIVTIYLTEFVMQ